MFEVFISHEAEKYYKKQDKDTKRRINKCIDILSKEPLLVPCIKKLHGELEGKHRYEVGGIRIIYEVNVKNKTVEVKAIRGRGDVYKR
ncbi:MAG TPA: type II toxin-antitoxin system RelE/ParE family toxin [Nitrospiraceae bacterium]|nr:type II toxin-antitoxin system RelE/ParE family toxin [Nitrospiraceae bacterium]